MRKVIHSTFVFLLFISESFLQKLLDTCVLGRVFWVIAPDLDNVPKLQIEKDHQHVFDKTDMTVLLICCGISANGHVEFRQARGACLFTVGQKKEKVQCHQLIMVCLWTTWQWCHYLLIFRNFFHPSALQLVFIGYAIYHFGICSFFRMIFCDVSFICLSSYTSNKWLMLAVQEHWSFVTVEHL